MTGDDRSVLRDPELVDLLADEPELLAILDAYATTQVEEAYSTAPSSTWRRAFAGRRRGPILAAGLGAAALAFIATLLIPELPLRARPAERPTSDTGADPGSRDDRPAIELAG